MSISIYENTLEWRQKREALFLAETPVSMGELLSKAAEKFGDTVAIDFFECGRQLSFSEWDRKASQLANGLQRLGVCQGMHVGVMLSNTIEFPITWLALARMGAVMVPTNTAYTTEELNHVVNTADVQFLVLDISSVARAEAVDRLSSESLILIDNPSSGGDYVNWHSLFEGNSTDFVPEKPVEGSDLASIQFTSGTTGFPKGVMQSHIYWLLCGFNMGVSKEVFSTGTILGSSPFFYFDGLWFLMRTLTSGATLFQAERMSLSKKFQRLADTQVEVSYIGPLAPESSPQERNHNVKLFLTVGNSAEVVKEAQLRFGAPVRELYGMTEIAVALSVPYKIEDDSILGTCGVSNLFYEMKVVDEEGSEQPADTPGELLVRGMGITDGYYKNPEANEKSFVDGWFRTGDVFEKTPQGYFRFVSRIKDMIKRSGENIAAIEVENVIMRYLDVEVVAIIPVPDPIRAEEVKAVIQLREGVKESSFDYSAFRDFCLTALAKFKVPRYIEFVEDFDYTPSRKIIKSSLKKKDPFYGCWDYTLDKKIVSVH